MSQSSNAGTKARTTREESSPNKSDAARTVLINPESERDAFHRGLGCASKASGPTRSVSLSWAREQGLDACGNCAPDLAREVVTDGGRVVESPADGVDDLAFEYVHDPHDPEAFLVRCTTCGEIDECSDRGDAHSRADTHGLNCSATGVTPVSSKRVATDGGRDIYGCDTPDCDGEKEVVTPDGYVCQTCADQLAAEYEDEDPRLLTDGGEPAEECDHEVRYLEDFREPSYGDSHNGRGDLSLEADCAACGTAVLIDAKVNEVMEF
ncbi:hypothetical protein [Halostella salina]|uniref:hypothetical protein n=1 Tax=Halostella salina TaxID=1547897 RepID=UPI0013CE45B4|nr:hypothetical protein [Halostella salina]